MKKRNAQHSTFNAQRSKDADGDASAWIIHEGSASAGKFDLENRLMELAVAVIDLSEKLPATRAGNHIAGQILRSGTSPYSNHAGAEAAESRNDFVHKMKICHKELRETRRWARLIRRTGWVKDDVSLIFVLRESDELIRIFHASIKTAERNATRRSPGIQRETANSESRPASKPGPSQLDVVC